MYNDLYILSYKFQEKTVAINLPLKNMSIEEKLQAMEIIWEDLCLNAANVSSPVWHKNILHEREEGLERDDETVDWEKAKKIIRNDIT